MAEFGLLDFAKYFLFVQGTVLHAVWKGGSSPRLCEMSWIPFGYSLYAGFAMTLIFVLRRGFRRAPANRRTGYSCSDLLICFACTLVFLITLVASYVIPCYRV